MSTRILRNRSGMTVMELMIAVTLLSLVLVGTIAIFTSMLSMWAKGSSSSNANTYASLAMRKLVTEIHEGQSARLLNTYVETGTGVTLGRKLEVTFPYRASADEDYVRGRTGKVVTYYLSGLSGSETNGNYLWKSVDGTRTRLARNVELQTLSFAVTNGRLVVIKLKGYDQEGAEVVQEPIHQCVKMRNN